MSTEDVASPTNEGMAIASLLAALLVEIRGLRDDVRLMRVPKAVFSSEEGAAYLGISLSHFKEIVRAGFIAKCRVGEKARSRVVYRRADLDEYIVNRRHELDPAPKVDLIGKDGETLRRLLERYHKQ